MARVLAELTLAMDALTDQVTEVSAAIPRLEKTVAEIASEMPRVRFLRPRNNNPDR